MVFTPRFLQCVWNNLHWQFVFHHNPDAPTLEAFLAHYAADNANPAISWSDQTNGLSYLYDLSINQAQVTPALSPHAWRIKQTNENLWKLLPPLLLEGAVDWKKAWFASAKMGDVQTLTFILEQGFAANNFMQIADWPRTWFEAAGRCDVKMMRFLLEQGVDVNTRNEHGSTALEYAVAQYGGNYKAVVFLVDAGIKLEKVETLIQWSSKSVTCASEASEQTKIAKYLRGKVAEKTDESAEEK